MLKHLFGATILVVVLWLLPLGSVHAQDINNPDRLIKTFIAELLETDTITDVFIHKHLDERISLETHPHIVEALKEIKKDFLAYSEYEPADLEIKPYEHPFEEKKETTFNVKLIWGHTMSFDITHNRISNALFLVKSGGHTKIYFSA